MGNWVNNEPNGAGCFVFGDEKFDVKFRLGKLIWCQKIGDTNDTEKPKL